MAAAQRISCPSPCQRGTRPVQGCAPRRVSPKGCPATDHAGPSGAILLAFAPRQAPPRALRAVLNDPNASPAPGACSASHSCFAPPPSFPAALLPSPAPCMPLRPAAPAQSARVPFDGGLRQPPWALLHWRPRTHCTTLPPEGRALAWLYGTPRGTKCPSVLHTHAHGAACGCMIKAACAWLAYVVSSKACAPSAPSPDGTTCTLKRLPHKHTSAPAVNMTPLPLGRVSSGC